MSTTKKENTVLIDVPMPIETPRLVIRPVMPNDGAVMSEAATETLDDLKKWMIWVNEGTDPDHMETVARKGYAKFILREDIFLTGIEKATGRHVLWTGLHRFDWTTRRFNIGYWVSKSAQGKGYATEAANALTRYAFNALAARHVVIEHAQGNEASRHIIDKLGFVKEGVLGGDIALPDGTFAARHVYARTDDKGLPPLAVKWGLS